MPKAEVVRLKFGRELVGEPEELRRHCNPECFGRLDVDDKRRPARLLDSQVGWLHTPESRVDIGLRGTLVHVFIAGSVRTSGPSDLNEFLVCVHVRQPLFVREVHYTFAIMQENAVR